MDNRDFCMVVVVLMITGMISPTVPVTAQRLPDSDKIVTGFQPVKVDGFINQFASETYVNEWGDAKLITTEFKGTDDTSTSADLYTKFLNNQFLVGLLLPAVQVNPAEVKKIFLQYDADNDGTLSKGDIRLGLSIGAEKSYDDDPRTVYSKIQTIESYVENDWAPTESVLAEKGSDNLFKVGAIDIGSGIVGQKEMTQIEIAFAPQSVQNMLAQSKLTLIRKPAEFKGLDELNYALQVETTDGLVMSYPESVTTLSKISYAAVSYVHVYRDLPDIDIFSVDVGIDHIEVMQVVQTETNDLPLVRGKETLARVFVSNPTTFTQEVRVTLNGYMYMGGSLITVGVLTQDFTAPKDADIDRLDLATSCNFELPSNWVAFPDLTLVVNVDPIGKTDINALNNVYTETFDLVTTYNLNLYRIPINTGEVGDSYDLPSVSTYSTINDYFIYAYPTRPNIIDLGWDQIGRFDGNGDELLDELNYLVASIAMANLVGIIIGIDPEDLLPVPDQIHATTTWGGGLSDPLWGQVYGYSGLSYASWGSIHASSGVLVMAHEINHNIMPTPSAYHIGGCTADASDTDWSALYSDRFTHELGWVPGVGLMDGTNYDLMTYCALSSQTPPKWISGYRWERMVDRLSTFSAGNPEPPSLTLNDLDMVLDSTTRIISGYFSNTSRTITVALRPSFELPGYWDQELPKYNRGDPYRLEIKYSDGTKDYIGLNPTFTDIEGNSYDTSSFSFVVPDNGMIVGVSINDTSTGKAVGNTWTLNPLTLKQPLISLDSSYTRGEKPLHISWSILGNLTTLYYKLQYSPDFINWYPYGQTTTDNQMDVYLNNLPGSKDGNSVFRLLVSNGFGTQVFYSHNVTIGNLPPTLEIRRSVRSQFREELGTYVRVPQVITTTLGSTISLDVTATNQLGNSIKPENILYEIEKDVGGKLSPITSFTGALFRYQFKEAGTYNVTITATDPVTKLSTSEVIVIQVITESFVRRDKFLDFESRLVTQRDDYKDITDTSTVTSETTKTVETTITEQESATPVVPLSSFYLVSLISIVIARRKTKASYR
jgi:hypothetical protein